MPISVVCPGCKARFSVSEKFAGKKGPCPKCKMVITVPEAPAEEVKIHVPEQFASGGKDSKGRAVSKPILRKEAKIKPAAVAGIVGAIVVTFTAAFLLRNMPNKMAIIAGGLLIVSPALAASGYTFLREDELEPYRGRSLLVRATVCAFVYAALWGAFWALPPGILTGEVWQWLFVAPLFISVGAVTAWACLDLDFTSGAIHYCFYLLVTILLRAAVGLPALWNLGSTSV
jgi:hypothetical protein